jgi:hypothetical protein
MNGLSGLDVPSIDDTHHASVDRRFRRKKRKRRLAAADEEHMLADAGANSIGRDERPSDRASIRRHRLKDEQLVTVEKRLLDRGHDIADDARDLHVSP